MAGIVPVQKPLFVPAVRSPRLVPVALPTMVGVKPGSFRAPAVEGLGELGASRPLGRTQSEFLAAVNGEAYAPVLEETPTRTFGYYKGRSKTPTKKIPRSAIFGTPDTSRPASSVEVPVLRGGVPVKSVPEPIRTPFNSNHPREWFDSSLIMSANRPPVEAVNRSLEALRAHRRLAWRERIDEATRRRNGELPDVVVDLSQTPLGPNEFPVVPVPDATRVLHHQQNVDVAKMRAGRVVDKISEDVGAAADAVKKPFVAAGKGVKAGWQKSEETLGHQLASRALGGIWKFYTGNGWWKGLTRAGTTLGLAGAAAGLLASMRREKSMQESNQVAAANMASESGEAGLAFSNHVARISRDLEEYANGRMSEANGFASVDSYANMMAGFGKATADVAKYRIISGGGTESARADAVAAADEAYRRQYDAILRVMTPETMDVVNRNLEAAGAGVTPEVFRARLDSMFLSKGGADVGQ